MTIGELAKFLRGAAASPGDFADWPPDLFALTSSILLRSGAYRFAVSPPGDKRWPPDPPEWEKRVTEASTQWRSSLDAGKPDTPTLVRETLAKLAADRIIETLAAPKDWDWDTSSAVLTLHALADQACMGLGIRTYSSSSFWLSASGRLSEQGTLAKFDPSKGRVLPKLRTPQVGVTLRGFSHHLAFHESEIDVRWLTCRTGPSIESRHEFNFLLVPWPVDVVPTTCLDGGTEWAADGRRENGSEPKQDAPESYQANARTISATAEMMQSLVQLGR